MYPTPVRLPPSDAALRTAAPLMYAALVTTCHTLQWLLPREADTGSAVGALAGLIRQALELAGGQVPEPGTYVAVAVPQGIMDLLVAFCRNNGLDPQIVVEDAIRFYVAPAAST